MPYGIFFGFKKDGNVGRDPNYWEDAQSAEDVCAEDLCGEAES